MKRPGLLALLTLALVLPLLPVRAMDLAATRAAIDAHIAQPRFPAARWGIAVVSLDSGRTLYTHDADRLFLPASTAKLYTAAAVLQTLDAGYRIPTRVLGQPPGRRGRMDGPLVLYGMGDPSLGAAPATRGWADRMAEQLAADGLRRVHGELVADATYFAGPAIGDGWEASDLLGDFAAAASALSVDENRLRVSVVPAVAAGRPARLRFDPAAAAPSTDNRLRTTPAGSANDINFYRAPGGDALYAFGSVAAGSPEQRYRLAVADPAQVAGQELLQALRAHGIRVDGGLRVLHWPQHPAVPGAGARVLAEVSSPPLAALLREGLKRSQNLYLQNLLQLAGTRAAAVADTVPATSFVSAADWGLRALRGVLDKVGIPPSASLVGEGTGLSRRDLTTPNALVRLLAFLAAGPDGGPVRDMLPIAGVDGTLARRMRGTRAAGNVRAKTGSMTYVNALAGYVTSAAGEHLAFAILLNDYQPPEGMPPSSAEVDAIAVWLAELEQRG